MPVSAAYRCGCISNIWQLLTQICIQERTPSEKKCPREMSQFWHSHWAEDAYKPGLLGNWQVPNWHPKWPCVRHCVTTTFLADKSGRLLPDKPKSKRSPWGDFKGTWELPLKIDRKLAQELSAPPKYKLAAWEAHKIHYEGPCGITAASPKTKEKPIAKAKRRKSPVKSPERARKPVAKSKRVIDGNKGKTAKTKKAEGTIAKAKGKDVKGKSAETKRTTARRAIEETEGGPERDQPKAMPVKDKSEVSEGEDQNTVSEESEYSKGKSVGEEPAYEEESTVTEEQEYKDDKVVSEESSAEKKVRRSHREEKTTECLCATNSDSKSLEKIAPKETTNTCTVHQRLRV